MSPLKSPQPKPTMQVPCTSGCISFLEVDREAYVSCPLSIGSATEAGYAVYWRSALLRCAADRPSGTEVKHLLLVARCQFMPFQTCEEFTEWTASSNLKGTSGRCLHGGEREAKTGRANCTAVP